MAGSEVVAPLTDDSGPDRRPNTRAATADIADRPPQTRDEDASVPAGPSGNSFPAWSRRSLRMIMVVDLVGVGSMIPVAQLFPHDVSPSGWTSTGLAAAVLALVWMALLILCGGTSRSTLGNIGFQVGAVLRAAGTLVSSVAVLSVWSGWLMPLYLTALGVPVALAVSAGGRLVAAGWLRRRHGTGSQLRRVVFVGDSPLTDPRSAARPETLGVELVGICTDDVARAEETYQVPVVRSIDDLPEFARRTHCDAVMVSGVEPSLMERIGPAARSAGLDILVGPGAAGVRTGTLRVVSRGDHSLRHVARPRLRRSGFVIKRLLDVIVAAGALVLLSPLMLVVAVVVKLDDPKAGVIFRQTRLGLHGRPFTMYKFRTMDQGAADRVAELYELNEASGPRFKLSDDPRVTRTGRVLRRMSIDELPQLVNVIEGSMSLVGPRPPLPDEVARYNSYERRRLDVVPGVTGLWQVSGRSLLSWEESIRHDITYIENWSLKLDLQILARTAAAVLSQRGAY